MSTDSAIERNDGRGDRKIENKIECLKHYAHYELCLLLDYFNTISND